jgi:enoyl-CoA hydratase/carnithine racemase
MAGLFVEKRGAIAWLTIDHPGKRNSVTAEMWRDFPVKLDALARDPEVLVLVVRGAGDDFSAGADIGHLQEILRGGGPGGAGGASAAASDGGDITAAEDALANFAKPTIAAIDGYCVGGGWELAAACDIRISSDRATFGVTPARIGIVYPLSGIRRLVEIAGPAAAKLLLFGGELVDAETALRFGMLTSVVPAGDLWAEVDRFAKLLAGRSQLSIHAMKDLVNAIAAGRDDLDERIDHWMREVAASNDPAVGAAAFFDRTPPRFTWRGGSGE